MTLEQLGATLCKIILTGGEFPHHWVVPAVWGCPISVEGEVFIEHGERLDESALFRGEELTAAIRNGLIACYLN